MAENDLCKCERCGRIRKLFQYTYFDVNRRVEEYIGPPINHGPSVSPQFTPGHIQRKVYDKSRGLCEECAVIINSRAYDAKMAPPPTPRGDNQ